MFPSLVDKIGIYKKTVLSVGKRGSSKYGRNMSQGYVISQVVSPGIIKGSLQADVLVQVGGKTQGGTIDVSPARHYNWW